MATLVKTIPPAPATKRGFASSLHSWQNRLAYCSGTCVFLATLEDFSSCQVYREHLHPTTCARFSPNGVFVASGDESGQVNVWTCGNEEISTRLSTALFNGAIKDIAWSEDSQRLVAVGQGLQSYGKVIMADSGNNIGEISGHSKTLLTCDFRPTRPFRIVTAGEDFLVNVCNGPPFRLTKSHQHHTNYVNSVRFSPDGQMMLSVSSDKKVLILAGESGELVKEIPLNEGHSGSIVACVWVDNGHFATCGLDKKVKTWDLEGVTRSFTVGEDLADQQVGLAYCAGQIVSLSLRGALNVWGNEDFPAKISLSHRGKVSNLAFYGNQLISADFEGNLRTF